MTGYRTGSLGYVHIGGPRVNGKQTRIYAHRLAWELANARPVPDGLVVMHACDNPRCVNPSHLSVGTQVQNLHDSLRKGRFNAFGVQKLNADRVRQIRALAATGASQKAIAARFGVARNTISQVVNRRTWAHLDRIEQSFNSLANVEPVRTVRIPFRGEIAFQAQPGSPQGVPVAFDLGNGGLQGGARHAQ